MAPLYTYYVLDASGQPKEGLQVQLEHTMAEAPLERHPQTGQRLQRCYESPCLACRYTPGHTQRILDTKNVEKAGFSKYVRDKSTGQYHRVAGKDGPETLRPS